MPKSTSSEQYLTVDEIRPRVDFVCLWRIADEQWYPYRVPSHQFLLVESGIIRARTSTGIITAVPGDLLCLRPLERNEYGFSGETVYFEAHMTLAEPPRQGLPLWLDDRPLGELTRLGEHAARARRAFETMCLQLDRPGAQARLSVAAAVHELLAAAAATSTAGAATPQRLDGWQRARFLLESELGRPLTMARAARELGVGVDHFIRGFRRRFGVSPLAYRTRAKMRQAVVELLRGEQSVKQVARGLGFSDASSFARAFRAHLGVAPSEIRAAADQPARPMPDLGDALFPTNRHIRPPGLSGQFRWG
ncbi:MAG: helix-turn-helix transcriptional regulator [Planctomycetes bacterium]|nr:helix-turn-helix transcriptional regulator [Planctomycetota bacterium]